MDNYARVAVNLGASIMQHREGIKLGSVRDDVSLLASESSVDPRKQKVQEEFPRKVQCRKPSSDERQTLPQNPYFRCCSCPFSVSLSLFLSLSFSSFSRRSFRRYFAWSDKGRILKRLFLVGCLSTEKSLHFAGYEFV